MPDGFQIQVGEVQTIPLGLRRAEHGCVCAAAECGFEGEAFAPPRQMGRCISTMVQGLGRSSRRFGCVDDECADAWVGGMQRERSVGLPGLAKKNGAGLAALDAGIPGAFLLP
jgi:hypothetical protein